MRQATSLSDFMQATPLLRALARAGEAPLPLARIGRTLARLNFGGSGRTSGALLLARIDGAIVGFAVLQVKPGGTELSWLYATGESYDDVLEALCGKVSQTAAAWQVRTILVGYFADLPSRLGGHGGA